MPGRKPWGAAALALILCVGWTEGEPRVGGLAENAVAVLHQKMGFDVIALRRGVLIDEQRPPTKVE